MAWFWFWVVADLAVLALDAAWWILAMRLTKRTGLRVLVSVFIGTQMLVVVLLGCGVEWPLHLPRFVWIAFIVWHRFVLPFGTAILLLLGSARAILWLTRRSRSHPANPETANGLTRREFIGAFAAIAPPLFTIGSTAVALAQLNQFRVRRFTLSIPSLPRPLHGTTIVHVSDMHVGRLTSGRVLRQMVNTTNAFRADLVVMTGDLIHYELDALPEAIALLKAMESRSGLWMVEGNHDLFDNATEFERRVKASGVPLLLNESATTTVRGYPVQLFGLRWLSGHGEENDHTMSLQLRGLIKRRQPEAFPILLAHHPHAFDAAVASNLPLTLAGHTHGGQWMLNQRYGVGSVLFRYWSGLYARAHSQMIVSNGVGNMFPIRINAPAELVHITLRCA